jgi:hypothetical protein
LQHGRVAQRLDAFNPERLDNRLHNFSSGGPSSHAAGFNINIEFTGVMLIKGFSIEHIKIIVL